MASSVPDEKTTIDVDTLYDDVDDDIATKDFSLNHITTISE